MRKGRQRLSKVGSPVLLCAVLLAWFLLHPVGAMALQAPPPPPTPTDTPDAPPPPTPTDTPEPPPPTPTDTPQPPAPTPTDTPQPPSPSDTPKPPVPTLTQGPPAQPTATNTKAPKPPASPDCQSAVEGTVVGPAGTPANGATVTIQGDGWSDGTLTNDLGHYGFGGLCAGTVTLQATFSNGQTSHAATLNLTGKDSIQLDLGLLPAATVTLAPTTQQTPTSEPGMPATGYSGWLLVGGALLGFLLLLSAGTRRLLGVRERTGDRD